MGIGALDIGGYRNIGLLALVFTIFSIGIISITSQEAFAGTPTKTWDGEGAITLFPPPSGTQTLQDWSDPLNWSGDTLPTGSDHILIPASTCPDLLNVDVAPFTLTGSLTVESGCDLQSFSGINQGTITTSGTFRISGNFDNQQTLIIQTGGILGVIGLDTKNSGTLTNGGTITIPVVNGEFTNTATGTLTNNNILNIAGPTSVLLNQGSIDGTGSITNSGTLEEDCGSTISGTQTISGTGSIVNVCAVSPPAISVTLIPPAPDGANGWYTSDVTVTWTVTGADSTVGCNNTVVNSDTSGTSFDCSATNTGGTTVAPTVTIKRDATPPTIDVQPADKLVEATPQNAALTLVTYEPAFSVSDNFDASPDIICEDDEENPLDNAADEFSKGVTPVSCLVVDDAGLITPATIFNQKVAEAVLTEICVNATCSPVNPDGSPDTTVEAFWGDVPDGSGDVIVRGTVWAYGNEDLTVDWGVEDTATDIITNDSLVGDEDNGATFESEIHNPAQEASSIIQTVTVTFPGSTITSNLNAKVNVLPHPTTIFLDTIQDPYTLDVFSVNGRHVDDKNGQGIPDSEIEFEGDGAVSADIANAFTSGFTVTDTSGGIVIDECCGTDKVLRLNVGATIDFPSNPISVILSLHDMGAVLVDVNVDFTTGGEDTFPATGQSQGMNTGLFMISHPDGISSIEITGVSEEVAVGITRIQALNSENVAYIDEEFETLASGESTSLSFSQGSFFSIGTSGAVSFDLLVEAIFSGNASYEPSESDPAPLPDPDDPTGVFLESHQQTYSVLFATAGGFGGTASITNGDGLIRTSILCAAGNDDDGDALCDDWEGPGNGVPIAGGGVYNLPGSDPNKKDIYVEIDYVSGQNPFVSGPNNDAIDDVIAAFAAAPVTNFGGATNGINLHVVEGDDIGPLAELIVWTDFNPDLDDFNSIKAEYFGSSGETDAELTARAQAYHYFIFANSIGGSSGVGEMPGNDGVVALGVGFDGTRAQKAGTFMHELGHNLNLNHGGPAIRDNADHGDNCKPNHDSVMTYSRQLPDLLGLAKWRLDYSDGDLRSNFPVSYGFGLRETTLYETFNLFHVPNPLRPSDPLPWIIWGTPGQAQPFLIQQARLSGGTPTGIDWSGNGITTGVSSSDINNFGFFGCQASSPSSAKIFKNYNEWTALEFNFRQTPTGSFDGGEPLDNSYPVPPDDYDVVIADTFEILGAYHQSVSPWNADSSYSTKGNVPIKVEVFDGEDIPIVGGDTTVSFRVFKAGESEPYASGPMEYDADKVPPHWHADWKPAKKDKGTFYIQIILPNSNAIPPEKITVDPDTDSDSVTPGNQPYMNAGKLMSMLVTIR